MGTHPIFESDFDCLTDTLMSVFGVIEDHDDERLGPDNRLAEVKCAAGQRDRMVPIFFIPANEAWYNAATLELIRPNRDLARDVLLKVVHSTADVVRGELLFPPNSTKELQNTGNNEVYYTVTYGEFLVTINGQKRLIKEGEFFWVPAGNDYEVKVIGEWGELRFHLLKNRGMLAAEEPEDAPVAAASNSLFMTSSEMSEEEDEM